MFCSCNIFVIYLVNDKKTRAMKYLGSKNRIAKHILPIMLKEAKRLNINTWVEPFVGGGNMIDKVPPGFKRIGTDLNPHVIQALIDIRDEPHNLLEWFSAEDLKLHKDKSAQRLISHACIVTSFGADLKGGYAREKNSDESTFCMYGKRNALKQSPNLQGVEFIHADYTSLSHLENCLIYCDPPYEGTTSYKTGDFNHSDFWSWCREMSKKNAVFISEYKAPEDFLCVWKGVIKTNLASQRVKATHFAKEKLFIINDLL